MSKIQRPKPSSKGQAAAPGETKPVGKFVVRPPGDPERERQERMRKLFEEHGPFILGKLSRSGVNPASAEDLRQEAVEILSDEIDETGIVPSNVRGYLTNVIRNLRSNRSRLGGLDIDADAEVAEAMTSSLDPEQKAQRADWLRRLARHIDRLSREDAEAFDLVVLGGEPYAQAAKKLGRAIGTVATQVARARAQLEGFAQASDRAADARLAALDDPPEE